MSDTTLEQALLGYDEQFKEKLTQALIETIFLKSVITEGTNRVCALRSAETARALETALGMALALSPTMDVPSRLREETDNIAKRLRRNVAKARAEGIFNKFGAAPGGTA